MIHKVEAKVKRNFKTWQNFETLHFNSKRGQKQKINNHIIKLNKLLKEIHLKVIVVEEGAKYE